MVIQLLVFRYNEDELMSAFRFTLLWLLFAATYFGFFLPIFQFFPEIWLHNLLTNHGQNFMDEGVWDTIFMSIVMFLTLVVNLVCIFFSLTMTKRIRKPIVSGSQQSGKIQMSVFKFSLLWTVFAVTYCVFYALTYSFSPLESLLSYLLREDYQNLIIDGTWYLIFVSTVMGTALVVNLVFIFLSLTITAQLRKRKKAADLS